MNTPRLHLPLTASGLGMVRLIQHGLAMTCLLLISGMGWLWWESQRIEIQISEHEAALAKTMETGRQFRQQAEAKGFNLSDQWLQVLPQHVAFADELALLQKFSWTQFLNDLESAVPQHVSMDAVALDFKKSTIALSGAALSLDDLSALVNGLERHPAFHEVVLANHKIQKKKDKDNNQNFSFFAFNLEVTYDPNRRRSSKQQSL